MIDYIYDFLLMCLNSFLDKNLLDQQTSYSSSHSNKSSSYSGAVSVYSSKASMTSSTRSRPVSATHKAPSMCSFIVFRTI